MTTRTRDDLKPIDKAVIQALMQCDAHCLTGIRAKLDAIMEALPSVMAVVPRQPYVEHSLRWLVMRGTLSVTGAGYRVEKP